MLCVENRIDLAMQLDTFNEFKCFHLRDVFVLRHIFNFCWEVLTASLAALVYVLIRTREEKGFEEGKQLDFWVDTLNN